MLAETNRAPFDLPEAEAELVAGYHTEYSSMKFAIFFMGEYMNMIAISAIVHDAVPRRLARARALPPDVAAGIVWFMLKVTFLMFFFLWVRWTFPRLRYDQLMDSAGRCCCRSRWSTSMVTALAVRYWWLVRMTAGLFFLLLAGMGRGLGAHGRAAAGTRW